MPKLATKATSSPIDKLERKISQRGSVRAGIEFTLFIANEDMNDTHNNYNDTCDCFIDSTYGFFIDITSVFSLINAISGKGEEGRVSSIISIAFNDGSPGIRSY